MSKPMTVVIALVAVLVVAGVIAAQVQGGRKTAELMDQLNTEDSRLAVDTMHELKKRGRSVEAPLIARLNSNERKERTRAALLLGEIGRASKSGPALLPLLEDESAPVRRAAATALGQLAHAGAVHPLLRLAQDQKENLDTRSVAVRSLSLVALAQAMDEADRELCVPPLVDILARRPKLTPEQAKALTKARKDLTKRLAKAEQVKKLAPGKKLKKERKEPPEPVKPAPPPGALLPEAPPADLEVELRADAVLALGILNTPSALGPLFESAKEAVEVSAVVRKAAYMAIEDLPDIPRSEADRTRMAHMLLEGLKDTSPEVRMTAARALARHPDFGSEAIDEPLDVMLQYMAEELTEYGEPDYWVRAAALSACEERNLTVAKPVYAEASETTELPIAPARDEKTAS